MSPLNQEKSIALKASRFLVIASCSALILVYSINNLLAEKFSISLWLLQVLPLAAMLPGLIKSHPRSYQWICFLILLYFIQGVLESFTAAGHIQGLVEIFFCMLLFCAAVFYIHRRQKIQQQDNNQTTPKE